MTLELAIYDLNKDNTMKFSQAGTLKAEIDNNNYAQVIEIATKAVSDLVKLLNASPILPGSVLPALE